MTVASGGPPTTYRPYTTPRDSTHGRHAGGAGSQAAGEDRSQRLSAVARAVAGWPVAGVVECADGGVGVARTGPAVQDVGRSTLDVGATDPCRAVSARGDVAGDVDPLGEDRRAARRRRARDQPGGPATGAHGVSDDRRDHDRVTSVEGRPATLRPTSAGLSGVGRAPVRDRWAVGGGDVVRARRLPTLQPFRAGGAPQRTGRDRRSVGSATRWWVHLPSRATDVALGALRGGDERIASTQPGSRLLRGREGSPERQVGHHLDGPQTRPPLLPRAPAVDPDAVYATP